MKRSLHNLKGYSVQAIDGPKGKVKDFLFDEDTWIIRYVEVDYGNFFKSKRVLIPRVFLGEPDHEHEEFPVDLASKRIENCPDIQERMPVSREYEAELATYYDIDTYWPYAYSAPGGVSVFFPPRPMRIPNFEIDEAELLTSLRSFNEICGYKINATDGKFGVVEDAIADDDDWQVIYLVIDTKEWVPWSKDVIVSIDWINSLSFKNKEVYMGISVDSIKDAPEIKLRHPIDIDSERALYEYYADLFIDS